MTCRQLRIKIALTTGLALAAMLACGGARAEDAYRLLAGDTVAISVAGMPDLSQEAKVQLDGSLSLPLVGEVRAAGRTLNDVRESIRTAIASRLVPAYTSDGQEHLRAVTRDQVSATIAEYRPVFVSGQVARPGELKYSPGMTVRQAIAAAGGVAAAPVVAPVTNVAGLEADYSGAWHALAAVEARVWRLRTELGEHVTFDLTNLPPAPQENTSLKEIVRVETELRQARDLDQQRERAYLQRASDQINQQAAVLNRELEVEKKTELADAADLANAEELANKGLLTNSRLSEFRGAVLTSATRRLQTESNLMQLERRRTDVGHNLERLDNDRRLSLLDELQRTQVERASDLAKLNAIVARLRAAGVTSPATGSNGEIVVSVVHAGSAEPISAPPGLELRPGDVVQVSRGSAGTPADFTAQPAAVEFKRTAAVQR